MEITGASHPRHNIPLSSYKFAWHASFSHRNTRLQVEGPMPRELTGPRGQFTTAVGRFSKIFLSDEMQSLYSISSPKIGMKKAISISSPVYLCLRCRACVHLHSCGIKKPPAIQGFCTRPVASVGSGHRPQRSKTMAVSGPGDAPPIS